MKALVYHGPGDKAWEEVAQPDVRRRHRRHRPRRRRHDLRHRPAHPQGRRPGGDRRPHPRPRGGRHRRGGRRRREERARSATGCWCRASPPAARAASAARARYGQCLGGGGWILGHKIDGTQAEYVRVPFADTSTYPVPAGVSRRADADARRHPARPATRSACSTARSSPGDVVAVVGAGPDRPGRDHGRPAVQPEPHRRHRPGRQPARGGQAVRRRRHRQQRPRGRRSRSSRELTGGLGADVAIEAVGVPATFELAAELVRPGGHVANIGVHGEPATLHLEELWIRERHHHHRPRRHLLDADAAAAGRQPASSTPAGSSPTTSASTSSCRPTTCSPGAADTGALKVVLSRDR